MRFGPFNSGVFNKRSAFAAAVALLLPAGVAMAIPLTNGNFESAANADSSTNTFANWGESAGNVAIKATTPLSGSNSALLTGFGNTTGTLNQNVDPITGTFSLSFSFAGVNPGTGANLTDNRSFQLLLTGTNGAQINMIVTRGTAANTGSVHIYGPSAFNAIGTLADKINFSSSLSTPVVNTVTVAGSVGGNYTVTANGTTSGPMNFYQAGGTGTTPGNFVTANFTTANATTVNYVVDDVVLVPEPASVGLLAIGAMACLIRRRRTTLG